MTKYFRAFALIPRSDRRESWFCIPDEESKYITFLAGTPKEDESFRECIKRSVCQSLRIEARDILVSNMAQLNLEYVDLLPGEQNARHIAVAFHMVHLYRKPARNAICRSNGIWLTRRELLCGETFDGRSIDPILIYFLKKSEVLPISVETNL